MPIQCDGFAIKSCSGGLSKLFQPSLTQETWIEVDQDSPPSPMASEHLDTPVLIFSGGLNDGNTAQTARTLLSNANFALL
jgi:hypothetical protein